jgi:hypothetical protein
VESNEEASEGPLTIVRRQIRRFHHLNAPENEADPQFAEAYSAFQLVPTRVRPLPFRDVEQVSDLYHRNSDHWIPFSGSLV